MKRSHRLSVALHVLVHLAQRADAPMTSEDLATCARTNPVVIRRTLAGLREAGLVRSTAGPGGGWSLARDPARISVGEVCAALGGRLLFAVDLALESGCRLQEAVSGAMDGFLEDAEALLLARLDEISVADLAARVRGKGGKARVTGPGGKARARETRGKHHSKRSGRRRSVIGDRRSEGIAHVA